MSTLDHSGTLTRFHAAHRRNGVYTRARREITQGRKQTHWMWFIFPQLAGLARSEMSRYYGIADRDEAAAYLDDPTLRVRLFECASGVLGHRRLMFPYPDNHKLRSSMTLFAQVANDPALPNAVLSKFFDGPDQLTLDLLAGKPVVIKPPRRPAPVPLWGKGMGRHWEAVATVGRGREQADPWTRERVNSFVRSFGLSTVAARQMVDAWMADQARARRAGWSDHADSDYYDQQ